jgi:serine/threonine protein kinase
MPKHPTKQKKLDSFSLTPGRVLAGKYEVISFLGGGWEGEVYRVRETITGIERAAKLFFPHRNLKEKASLVYAKKLYKLKDCPILIQYHTHETVRIKGTTATALISEYVEGELLSQYIAKQRGKFIPIFHGIHLLHALATGVETIHTLGEYHGDLHSDNIIVRRLGLSFDLKLIDLYHWGRFTKEDRDNDICDLINLFYQAIGGRKRYKDHPQEIKDICCGLKRSLILKKFKTVGALKIHLETQPWS